MNDIQARLLAASTLLRIDAFSKEELVELLQDASARIKELETSIKEISGISP